VDSDFIFGVIVHIPGREQKKRILSKDNGDALKNIFSIFRGFKTQELK